MGGASSEDLFDEWVTGGGDGDVSGCEGCEWMYVEWRREAGIKE